MSSEAKKTKSKKKSNSKAKSSAKETPSSKTPQTVEIVKADSTKGIALLSRAEAAELDAGIDKDMQSANKSLIAMAIKLDQFKAGQGWKALGFLTMNEWREKKMNFSTFYNATAAMKLLNAGVPAKQVESLSLTNMNEIVRKLPQNKWTDPEILKAATGSVATFEKIVTQKSDEICMHIEERGVRSFSAGKSSLEKWDLAMKIAESVEGCQDAETRVEAVCAAYINSASREVGKTKQDLYWEYDIKKAS